MSYLEMKNVSYTYPSGYEAIQKVDLQFELGESVAIIGQNGAGKTTTVKLMNRLLEPTSGKVLVDGLDTKTKTTAEIANQVGYVFQNPDDQIFQETIYKEIAFGLKNKKMSPTAIDEKVLEVAKLCGLETALSEHPYNLPYSKRKFITIAAIVAMDTQVIILDEPTAGQDPESTQRLSTIINQLAKQNKIVLTITHDMEFVANHFERVIVFADKKQRSDSTPAEIFWDEELLTLASLKQPYICQLAKLLGYRGIVTIDELLERRYA